MYAIKLELAPDEWIYITRSDSEHCWDLRPQTFKSKSEAEKAANVWRKKCNVKVEKII